MSLVKKLELIGSNSILEFSQKHELREQVIKASREVIRNSANSIRAVHRNELSKSESLIKLAREQVIQTKVILKNYPELYFTGYTLDAQKEYAEACFVYAVIANQELPLPEYLQIETASYLNGLAEGASELRRYILDSLRKEEVSRTEELMECMDEVYNVLVSIDFPDALTSGLRRTTDQLRGVLERTRGDLTMTLRQRRLEKLLGSKE
tara:strand:- start:19256 stop:19882 length:627 start_codon:yes stop_codon:yes gene_type:complete